MRPRCGRATPWFWLHFSLATAVLAVAAGQQTPATASTLSLQQLAALCSEYGDVLATTDLTQAARVCLGACKALAALQAPWQRSYQELRYLTMPRTALHGFEHGAPFICAQTLLSVPPCSALRVSATYKRPCSQSQPSPSS